MVVFYPPQTPHHPPSPQPIGGYFFELAIVDYRRSDKGYGPLVQVAAGQVKQFVN
jgi:hypothetical protein